jgi:hypothetical protein
MNFSRLLVGLSLAGVLTAAGAESPVLFSLSAKNLAGARERLTAGDAALQPALKGLRADADRALEMKPVSVMDKKRTAVSGDKHDYLSQAPYFWPDPAKPDGLPYIRRDGERNPEVDRDTDRPAIGRLREAIRTLALAYYFTRHEPYAEHATRLVRVWFLDPATRMNPHLDYAQYIPGVNTGRGIGIIETAGLGETCDDVALLSSSPAWTKEDARGWHDWLGRYFTWLTTSANGLDEADEENNHGTWYDVQTAHLALVLGKNDVAKKILGEGLKQRIAVQIEPNGAQPRELARTRSLNYSLMNLRAFFTLARLGEHVQVDGWNYATQDGRSLRAALAFLAPYADPAKPWVKKDLNSPDREDIIPLLIEGGRHWKDPAFEQVLAKFGNAPEERDARWRLLLNAP